MLTPEHAKNAFLASMPRRRAEFARRVDERRRSIAHENDYVRLYPVEVMRFAEDEVRRRHHAAAERIKELLDSGWAPPHATAVRAAFTGCFQFSDFREDPFSDIYERVVNAYAEIGQPVPQGLSPKLDIGAVQVQVVKECLSDLEMYVPKSQQSSTILNNYAPVGAQQVGSGNVANTSQTNTSVDAGPILAAVQTVASHLADFPDDCREEVEEHLASIKEELDTPAPRATRLKAWLASIRRAAGPIAESGAKAVTEGAVSGAIKSLMGGG